MLRFVAKRPGGTPVADSLTLPFELRQKSRQRVVLDSGREAGLLLPPGTVLRDGDVLCTESGELARVHAAPERVGTARTADPVRLARACYHLGNRHVPLQIGAGWLRYAADHVLDELVVRLGLQVVHEEVPFEPEGGAYAGHAPHAHHRHA